MLWLDLLTILIITGVLSAVLVGAVGWRYPSRDEGLTAALFLFLVFFLVLWAARLWVVPIVASPALYFSGWLWLIVIGILLALVIGAVAPPRRRRPDARSTAEETVPIAFGLFFWVLMLTLIALIVAGYAYHV